MERAERVKRLKRVTGVGIFGFIPVQESRRALSHVWLDQRVDPVIRTSVDPYLALGKIFADPS